MLADPDPDVLDGLAHSLNRAGFLVQAASNERACSRLLHEFAPDTLVLEPDVKNSWGWRLLIELAELADRPPTVILSRFTESVSGTTSWDKWLVKPVTTSELAAAIRAVTAH